MLSDTLTEPNLITGGFHSDTRGGISFINDFDMSPIKRFSTITHLDTKVVRAWQGHKKERKWFYVTKGEFQLLLVRPDDWIHPSFDLRCKEYTLQAASYQILQVPAGYASGFKALIPDSEIMVFSDQSLSDSLNDDFRFDKNLWYNWNKL